MRAALWCLAALPVLGIAVLIVWWVGMAGPKEARPEAVNSSAPLTIEPGTWQRRCAAGESGAGPVCAAVLELKDQASGLRLLTLEVIRLQDRGTRIVILAPLNIRLQDGVRLLAGEEVLARMPVVQCTLAGCAALVQGDTQSLLAKLLELDTVSVRFVAPDAAGGRAITVSISMDRFAGVVGEL